MTRLLLLRAAATTVAAGAIAVGSMALASMATGSMATAAASSPPTPAPLACETATVTTTETTAPATSTPASSTVAPAETAAASTTPSTVAEVPSSPGSLQIPLPNATAPPGSTAAAASTASTASTSAPPLDEVLVLGRDGLGVVSFCDDADVVIATMSALAGPPDDDTGWVDPFSISACGGTIARRVTWGSLDLYFGDDSRFASGVPHFFGYSYGNIDGFDVTPSGLATPEGVGLGTPVAYLRATYPEVAVFAGEEGIQEPAFYVDDNLGGLLTSDTDDGVITLIIGGEGCGV